MADSHSIELPHQTTRVVSAIRDSVLRAESDSFTKRGTIAELSQKFIVPPPALPKWHCAGLRTQQELPEERPKKEVTFKGAPLGRERTPDS
jgi:hypothetical protein